MHERARRGEFRRNNKRARKKSGGGGMKHSREAAQIEQTPDTVDAEFGFGNEELEGAFDESGHEGSRAR